LDYNLAKIDTFKQQIDNNEKLTESLLNKIDNIKRKANKLNKDSGNPTQKYIIYNQKDLLNIINNIYKLLKQNGLSIVSSNSGTKNMKSGVYFDNFLTLQLKSNYQSLYEFLNKLENYYPQIHISKIVVNRINDSELLNIKIDFMAFTK
jgi:primase-polymerase (primpol)-like protein